MTAAAAPLTAAAEAAAQTFEIAADDTIHFDHAAEEPTEQEDKDKLAAYYEAGERYLACAPLTSASTGSNGSPTACLCCKRKSTS